MDKEMRSNLLKDKCCGVAICTMCWTEFNAQLFDMDNFNYCPNCGKKFEVGDCDG